MKRAAVAISALSIVLTGCVSPLVTPRAPELQYRVNNALHWSSLAKRAVVAIPFKEPGTRVYVVEPQPFNRFSPIYRRYLWEALVDSNYQVVDNPTDAQILLYSDVEPILYDQSGKKLWGYGTALATAAAAGGQFRDISSTDTGFAAGIATGLALDFAAALNGTTRAEVIVTSTIKDGRTSKIYHAKSESFYVRPADLEQFYEPEPPVVALRVTDGGR